jgi:sugar lactone lactonase YvrE
MTSVRTTVHDALELDVLADGLGFPEGPCIDDDNGGSVLAVDIDHGTIVWTSASGGEVVPGDVTTNVAFGGTDRRRAVITLSRTGRLVETTWPRPGLALHRP